MGFWGSLSRGFYHAGGAHIEDSQGKDYYGNDGSVGYGIGNTAGTVGMGVRQGYERAGDIVDTAKDVLNPDNWLLIGAGILGVLVLTRK
jgi:hypothetical protein